MNAINEANDILLQFDLEIQITKTYLEAKVWDTSTWGEFISDLLHDMLIFSISAFDMCLFLLRAKDKRMCSYKSLNNNNLKRNNLSPFPSFHCIKIQTSDYDTVLNQEDKSNLINFQTQSVGFVCDTDLWKNVIVVKLANSIGKNMPSIVIAHNVLHKLGLGNHLFLINLFIHFLLFTVHAQHDIDQLQINPMLVKWKSPDTNLKPIDYLRNIAQRFPCIEDTQNIWNNTDYDDDYDESDDIDKDEVKQNSWKDNAIESNLNLHYGAVGGVAFLLLFFMLIIIIYWKTRPFIFCINKKADSEHYLKDLTDAIFLDLS